jgi:type II secretory pathway component PulL
MSYNANEEFNSWLDESYPYEGKLSYSFALFSLYYEDYLVRLEEFRDSSEEED